MYYRKMGQLSYRSAKIKKIAAGKSHAVKTFCSPETLHARELRRRRDAARRGARVGVHLGVSRWDAGVVVVHDLSWKGRKKTTVSSSLCLTQMNGQKDMPFFETASQPEEIDHESRHILFDIACRD